MAQLVNYQIVPQVASLVRELPAPYLYWACVTDYLWVPGALVNPVAGPQGTPPVITQVHACICYKVITFAAIRLGAKPQIPSPNTQGDETLVGKAIRGTTLGRLLDGSPVVAVGGCYVYIMTQAPNDNDPLFMGQGPYDTTIGDANATLLPSDFSQNIINPVPTIQGAASGPVPPEAELFRQP